MEHLDQELLSAYIDQELPAADMAAVEQHLAACDTCRAEYEELRALSTLVRELPIYEPKRVIDVSAHPRGGTDTMAKIIAFSKPLAIAAVVLLVAFAGLRLLNDDEPDDSGDQISFSAVQPTEPGTELPRGASEVQDQERPAGGASSDEAANEAPPPAAQSEQRVQEAPADSATSDDEVLGEAPPMGAMGAMPQGPPGTASVVSPGPVATPTAVPTVTPAPESESGADSGNGWLPVAIVAAAIIALAGTAGWYRFVRPRRRGT